MDPLLQQAREAKQFSYSPYSNFKVGAAVEMSSGQVYTGCNIENASYGLALCAERTAIFKAISSGESAIKRLAVSCPEDVLETPSLMPCGACRQVIAEFADPETEILVDGAGSFRLQDLLPMPFAL